jgi:hypothetical protein
MFKQNNANAKDSMNSPIRTNTEETKKNRNWQPPKLNLLDQKHTFGGPTGGDETANGMWSEV